MFSVQTDYLTNVLDNGRFLENIKVAKKLLKDVEFDAFVVSGNSGTLFVGAIAATLKKDIILVRKPNDSSHSMWKVEGNTKAKKLIFLDDFVCSGATFDRVKKSLKEDYSFKESEIVGQYLWFNQTLRDADGVRIRHYDSR